VGAAYEQIYDVQYFEHYNADMPDFMDNS